MPRLVFRKTLTSTKQVPHVPSPAQLPVAYGWSNRFVLGSYTFASGQYRTAHHEKEGGNGKKMKPKQKQKLVHL